MKYLFLLPLFYSLSANAQLTEQMKKRLDSLSTAGNIISGSGIRYIYGSIIGIGDNKTVRKKDTVSVIMLCIDTAIGSHPAIFFLEEKDRALNEGRYAFWIKGYSVRELHNSSEGVFDSGFYKNLDGSSPWGGYWQHIHYLGQDKKLLNKNTLVWMAQSVN